MGFFFTLIKGEWMNLIGSNLFDLDFLSIVTAYLFLYYGAIGAGVFAFWQGFLIDLFSGGLNGLSALLYLVVVGGLYLSSLVFDLRNPRGQIIIVGFLVLLKKIAHFVVLWLFSLDAGVSKTFLLISGASIFATGLFAPFVFCLFDWLRGITSGDESAGETKEIQVLSGLPHIFETTREFDTGPGANRHESSSHERPVY